ncbi:3760_t:CDS:2 [Dentiscutata erythropus]|uniref:3760_t:CDS:1 n=1 Tax=Dentiscutata erythropus TaxID=1348616 RepID=A0A9N9NRF2_9GLOM|nr:3760_t:CDS:2 [Dentiscutata erythropus]
MIVPQKVEILHASTDKARPTVESRNSTTSFLTATTLIYAIGAGITAAAGTRLALQLFLVKGFKLYSFQLQDPKEPSVSQAPSPESNPNSPLPVKTMVGLYPTIES